jgi:hypothetical protein
MIVSVMRWFWSLPPIRQSIVFGFVAGGLPCIAVQLLLRVFE